MQFSLSFTQRFFQALRMIHIHGSVIPFLNYKVSSFILYVYDIPSEWVSVEYCVPGRSESLYLLENTKQFAYNAMHERTVARMWLPRKAE